MLMLMTLFACDDALKTNHYDISSTVMVFDSNGFQVDRDDVNLCQVLTSEDYDTTTQWSVQAEQCESVAIQDGLVVLSNWEGEYFGPDVSVSLDMRHEESAFPATLIDDDSEVWCDNQVATKLDEHQNVIESSPLCEQNFERYLLWSLVLPVDLP